MEQRLIHYSMELAFLARLLEEERITEEEYNRTKAVIMKDYNIVADIAETIDAADKIA